MIYPPKYSTVILLVTMFIFIFSFQAVSPKSGEILVSICSTGRLMAFISSYKAQFIASDG